MTLRDQIVQQALSLPAEDRAYVADLLEGSLPESSFCDPEIAAAWSQEIERRIQAYDRGETTAVDFDVALEQMHQALAAHRSSKSATP